MTVNSADVIVGTTGSLSVAPFGTALPTTHTSALNAAFSDLGYISDAGVSEDQGTSSNKIKAWQNGDVVRTIQSEHDLTFKFVAIESNSTVLAAFYGNYVSGDVEINGLQPAQQSWVLDVIDGLTVVRTVIPYGQVSERGSLTYSSSDTTGYDMTITAYTDPNYAGSLGAAAKAYKYLLNAAGGIS